MVWLIWGALLTTRRPFLGVPERVDCSTGHSADSGFVGSKAAVIRDTCCMLRLSVCSPSVAADATFIPSVVNASAKGLDGEWRKLHIKEFNDLYSSSNIVRVIKSRRMRWAGHMAHIEEGRGVHKVLVGKETTGETKT